LKTFRSFLLLIASVLPAAAFAASPAPVSALSCAGQLPLEEERARADAIFRGEVASREVDRVTLRVTAVWKGEDVGPTADVLANMWVDFHEDGEYVVFAERQGDAWFPILCGSSGTPGAFVRGALGEPIASFPKAERDTPPALSGKAVAVVAASLVVVAAASFAAGARWGRRRAKRP